MVRATLTARRTWLASINFACSVTAMSPAERIKPPRLLDHDADGLLGRGRDTLVDHDFLVDELGELGPVHVRIGHRGLDEHLVSGARDAGPQGGENVRQVLDVASPDEDEIAGDAVDLHARPRALRVAAGNREALLLHRGQDEPLQVAELRELVDEEDALVGLVDRAGYDAVVRLGAELGVP